VAEFLENRGYPADALRGGFDAWKEQGFATEPLAGEERLAA
jgi:rhodanese-related sulfurtransferase